MSFVPAPQQANAASANRNATVSSGQPANAAAAAGGEANTSNNEHVFKVRTFDVYWVDKKSLMYKDGIAKVCVCRRPCWCWCCWSGHEEAAG